MPGRDGTGPMGQGAGTGRGQGNCSPKPTGYGRALGLGLGYGHGCGNGRCMPMREVPVDSTAQQEWLRLQKTMMEARIEQINKQIGDQDKQ